MCSIYDTSTNVICSEKIASAPPYTLPEKKFGSTSQFWGIHFRRVWCRSRCLSRVRHPPIVLTGGVRNSGPSRDGAAEELAEINNRLPQIEHDIKIALLPKDKNDDKNDVRWCACVHRWRCSNCHRTEEQHFVLHSREDKETYRHPGWYSPAATAAPPGGAPLLRLLRLQRAGEGSSKRGLPCRSLGRHRPRERNMSLSW